MALPVPRLMHTACILFFFFAGMPHVCAMCISCPGAFVNRHAWGVKRMLTVFNDMLRRGHRPRDAGIRDIMISLGFSVPEQERRERQPAAGDSDSDAEGEGEEEAALTDDDLVVPEDVALGAGLA